MGPRLREKPVTVVGLGKSGLAAARLLQAVGAHVTVVDQQSESTLSQMVAQLDVPSLQLFTADQFDLGFRTPELVVISPGVPSRHEILEVVRRRGVPVISEIELASWFLPIPLVAVTGTNGKSTAVSLIARMFEENGERVFMGGNLGTPLCEPALAIYHNRRHSSDSPLPFDSVVAEVSSFQLEAIQHFHPKVAVLLNLTADHLDRYPSMAEYGAAKARIFANQSSEDFAVLNGDDPLIGAMRDSIRGTIVEFSLERSLGEGVFVEGNQIRAHLRGQEFEVALREEVGLRGRHNLANVLSAVAVALLCDCPIEAIRRAIRAFTGIAHALEVVRERGGVLFVNDSKGTNVDATLKALESFDRPVVIIMGGKDKGGDFTRLREPLQQRARRAILIGESAVRIREAVEGYEHLLHAASLEEAVTLAAQEAEPGNVVLLSPACASFDMFRDYRDRGEQFRDLVKALP